MPGGDDTVGDGRAASRALGVGVAVDGDRRRRRRRHRRPARRPAASTLDAGLAGTTSRFVTALAALAAGPVTIDGAPPLRRRPMGPLHDALAALGAAVDAGERAGGLPVTVTGPLRRGGDASTLPGDVSSQYLTALMLIAPLLAGGLRLRLTTPLGVGARTSS